MPFSEPNDKDIASYAESINKALEEIVYTSIADFALAFAGLDAIAQEFDTITTHVEPLLETAQDKAVNAAKIKAIEENPTVSATQLASTVFAAKSTANVEVLMALQDTTFFTNIPPILEGVSDICNPALGYYNLQHLKAFKKLFEKLSANRKQELSEDAKKLALITVPKEKPKVVAPLIIRSEVYPTGADCAQMEKYNIGRTTRKPELTTLVEIHITLEKINVYLEKLYSNGANPDTECGPAQDFAEILTGLQNIYAAFRLTYDPAKAAKLDNVVSLRDIALKLENMCHIIDGSLFTLDELSQNLNEACVRFLIREIRITRMTLEVSLCDKDALFSYIKISQKIDDIDQSLKGYASTLSKETKVNRQISRVMQNKLRAYKADLEISAGKFKKIILPLNLGIKDLDAIDISGKIKILNAKYSMYEKFLRLCKKAHYLTLLQFSDICFDSVLVNLEEIEDFCSQCNIPIKSFLSLSEKELMLILSEECDLNSIKIILNYYLLSFDDYLLLSSEERLQLMRLPVLAAVKYDAKARKIHSSTSLNDVLQDATKKILARVNNLGLNHSVYDLEVIAQIPTETLEALKALGLNFVQTRAIYESIHSLCMAYCNDYVMGFANVTHTPSYLGVNKKLFKTVFKAKDAANIIQSLSRLSKTLNNSLVAPRNVEAQVKAYFPKVYDLIENLKPTQTSEQVDAIMSQLHEELRLIINGTFDSLLQSSPNRFYFLMHYITHSVIAKKYELFPRDNWSVIARSYAVCLGVTDGNLDPLFDSLSYTLDGAYNFDKFFGYLAYMYKRIIKNRSFTKNEAEYINFADLATLLNEKNYGNTLYAHAIATGNPELVVAQTLSLQQDSKGMVEEFLRNNGFFSPEPSKTTRRLTFSYDRPKPFITRVINTLNSAGQTPLTIAAASNDKYLTLALLVYGANAALTNSADQSALDIARDGNNEAIIWDLGLFVEKNAPANQGGCLPRWRLAYA